MRVLPIVLLIVLAIYCWIEIAQSDPGQVRQLPRGLWALIVFVPLVGPIAWLVYGRPNGTDVVHSTPKPKSRPLAPDDDPDFLRRIDRRQPPDDGERRNP